MGSAAAAFKGKGRKQVDFGLHLPRVFYLEKERLGDKGFLVILCKKESSFLSSNSVLCLGENLITVK